MKRIYLKGYLYKNLGDDLFFEIITARYPNIDFYSFSKYRYNSKKNIKIYQKRRVLNKFLKLISNNKLNQERLIINKCDLCVIIGGSIFIQGKSSYDKYIFQKNKQYFILGSNFGPYQSDEFYKEYEKIFKNAQDVCFREKKSSILFKQLDNVRSTPDIVLSLDTSTLKKQSEKRVIFSIIDLSNRFNNRICELYKSKMINMINYFSKKRYKITLMSFCSNEGDEKAIKEILSNIKDNKLKNKIDIYNYNGNIEEALTVLNNCEIIVGSRFHANILGLVMSKTILPIAYSDKTINVLEDLKYTGKIIDIRKIEEFNVEDLTEDDLKYKLNINKYKKEAEMQFKKLDEILK